MTRLVHNVQKKQHKERSQVALRQRYGILEKKKDYRLRADDYHKKQAALKVLKEQAANYNPDEYYHAMTRKRTDADGIQLEDGNECMTVDQVKLLKLQDINYVRTMRLHESKRVAAEKQNVIINGSGKHTVFVDLEQAQEMFDPATYFDTDASMVERRQNRIRRDQLELNTGVITTDVSPEVRKKQQQEKLTLLKQLKQRLERERQLREVEHAMDMKQELLKKGNKKKVIGPDGKASFRWKQIRKR